MFPLVPFITQEHLLWGLDASSEEIGSQTGTDSKVPGLPSATAAPRKPHISRPSAGWGRDAVFARPRWQQAGLFSNRSQAGVGGLLVDNVPDGVVPNRPIPTASAREGMVSPSVKDLSTAWAKTVACENWNSEPAFQCYLAQGGVNFAAVVYWHGREPCPCPWDAAQGQVRAKGCVETVVVMQFFTGCGVEQARQSLLRSALSAFGPRRGVEDIGPEFHLGGGPV